MFLMRGAEVDGNLMLMRAALLNDPADCLELLKLSGISTNPLPEEQLAASWLQIVTQHAVALSRGTITLPRFMKVSGYSYTNICWLLE